jgi:hypothetical protein
MLIATLYHMNQGKRVVPRGAARFFVWINNHYIGKDMNTLDNDSCWSSATIQDAAEAILADHMANIKAYKEAARSNNMSIGSRQRELLVPILNRWGIGWDRGIWTFPMVIEDPSDPLSWTQSTTSNVRKVVTLSCNALYLVHDYLSQMLYESDGLGDCLEKYVEPIPLPTDVTYVWVTSRWSSATLTSYYKEDPDDSDTGTLTVEGTIPVSLTDIVPPLPIVGNHYHGPITQEYYDDVVSAGGSLVELVQNLPTYRAGPNSTCDGAPRCTWVLDRDWDRDYYYLGMLGY